jgi:glycosyltransferase involved in cell wall biosynthesis
MRPLPIAQELVRRGHNVDLLCLADTAMFTQREDEEGGVRIIETPDLLPGKLRSGWDPISICRRISWMKSRGTSWDIIQAQESRPATIYPVKWLLKRQPAALVMDWIDWWGRRGLITEARPRWYQILFGRLETHYEEAYRVMADGNTIISRPLVRRAESLGVSPDRICLLRNGIASSVIERMERVDREPGAKRRLRQRFGIPYGDAVILFSAMDVFFDAELVIRSIAELAREIPNVRLVTTGTERSEIHALAGRLGVSGLVQQLGRLSLDDYLDALLCANIFAVPMRDTVSNRGRWPSKVGDYMAAGRPLVANPVGDVASAIKEADVGLLAEYEPSSFAGACAQLLRDPGLQVEKGRSGREYAKKNLTWEHLIDDLERFYLQILETRNNNGNGDRSIPQRT